MPLRPAPGAVGTHLLVDAWGCCRATLDDPGAIEQILRRAVETGGATLIDLCVHQFSPIGVTATATLAESHIAIHTWPETGFCAADLFFCNSGDPEAAAVELLEGVAAQRHEVTPIRRGLPPSQVRS